nr:putative AAA-type ATPase family protein [Tanacetum cinerariifolium]
MRKGNVVTFCCWIMDDALVVVFMWFIFYDGYQNLNEIGKRILMFKSLCSLRHIESQLIHFALILRVLRNMLLLVKDIEKSMLLKKARTKFGSSQTTLLDLAFLVLNRVGLDCSNLDALRKRSNIDK